MIRVHQVSLEPESLSGAALILLLRLTRPVLTLKSKNLTVIIDERKYNRNQVFDAAEMYLRNKIGPEMERSRITKTPKQKHFTISIEKGEQISDTFEGSEVRWNYVQTENEKSNKVKWYYEFTFEKKLKEKVMGRYLSHVVAVSEEIKKSLQIKIVDWCYSFH